MASGGEGRSNAASGAGADRRVEDDAGYSEFFVRCWPKVRSIVAMRVADERFVEDEVQEAFLIARRVWPRLREYDKPDTWVVKVALRRMWRRLQQERNQLVAEPAFEFDPSDKVVNETALLDAVRRLPRRQAESMILTILGYPVVEIADILDIADGTVRHHVFQARRKLQEVLGRGAE